MKSIITTFLVLAFGFNSNAQSWTTINSIDQSNYKIINSFLHNDTLSIYSQTGIYSMPQGLAKQFEMHSYIVDSIQPILKEIKIIDSNAIIFSNFILPYQNTYVKFSTIADTVNQNFRLNYSTGGLDNYSNKVYIDTPDYSSTLTFARKINDNYYISISNNDINSNSTAVLLKLDSSLNVTNRLEVECVANPCSFYDVVRDKVNNTFVLLNDSKIKDSINEPYQYGEGLITLDSNLNIISGSNQLMQVNANYHVLASPTSNTFMGALAPVTDSTFMVMAGIFNPYYIFNPNTNPNPARDHDFSIGIRNASYPYSEIGGISKLYGKNDTAEYGVGENQQIIRYDSNLYVTSLTERFYLQNPRSWDTEAAIFGLNVKGDLHWSYYLPFDDYCWVSRMEKDDKGGLWVTGQCTEYDNNNNLHSFAKVTYIDSIAYWPRKSTPVGVNEPIKKSEEIKVFPNPTKDYFTVRQYYRPVQLHFTLLDQMGRLVQEQNSNYSDTQIDVSSLKSGVYFLRITDTRGNLISTEKIVKSN